MANAKLKGARIGRPHTTKDDIPQVFYKHYPAYKSGQLNTSEFARACDIFLYMMTYFAIIESKFYTLEDTQMAVSYNRLWKLLIDKKMSKASLRKAAGIAPNTMTKLSRDETVTLAVLEKICAVVDADFGDIMEYIPEEKHD